MTSAVSNSQAVVTGSVNSGAFSISPWILAILLCIGLIRLFKMVQIPAWKALIPGYNLWILSGIIKLPPLSILLWLVPFANVIYSIVFMARLAKAYNRGFLMTILLIVCSPIAVFIMGYSSKTKYIG